MAAVRKVSETAERIIDVLHAGHAMSIGQIARALDVDTDEIFEAMNELRRRGLIVRDHIGGQNIRYYRLRRCPMHKPVIPIRISWR